MKKLFPEEKGTKKGVREFLDKKGFYIVLLLCIAVVAGTAVFVTTRNATSEKPDYDAQNLIPEEDGDNVAINGTNPLKAQEPEDTQTLAAAANKQSDIGEPAVIANTDDGSGVEANDDTAKTTIPKATAAPAKSTAPKAASAKSTATTKQQNFVMPVQGAISLEYAMDKLVYSKTLEEWRVHKGVDIASDRGTPVKAVADGVISDVRNDSYYGITVVMNHSNGLQTLYRNLASDEIVSVNQKVKQGEVIGSIGNTAADESSEPPHLHFEVLKNDVNVDPMTYFQKSNAKVD